MLVCFPYFLPSNNRIKLQPDNLQIWKVRRHTSFEGYGSSTHLLNSLRLRACRFQVSIFILLTCQVSSIPSHVLNRSEADADKLYHPQNSDYLKNQVFEMFFVFLIPVIHKRLYLNLGVEETPLRGQQTVTLRDTQPRH